MTRTKQIDGSWRGDGHYNIVFTVTPTDNPPGRWRAEGGGVKGTYTSDGDAKQACEYAEQKLRCNG